MSPVASLQHHRSLDMHYLITRVPSFLHGIRGMEGSAMILDYRNGIFSIGN